MKALLKTRTIRNTLISAAAASAMALPLITSAGMVNTRQDIRIAYEKAELASAHGQQNLYARLKNASRRICGTSNIRITGSVRNSAETTQCYDDTLTAAVSRLDSPEITALHRN
jgi:UrcA family protein